MTKFLLLYISFVLNLLSISNEFKLYNSEIGKRDTNSLSDDNLVRVKNAKKDRKKPEDDELEEGKINR
uniref:Plasmodium yoelii subtelomeric region (PYST-C1) n=1 Tax=Strongyloides venezuelensis TaxID=75913 RepID=A0A0K0FFJ1_STRVS